MSTVHEPLRGASLKAALRAILDAPVRNLPTPEESMMRSMLGAAGKTFDAAAAVRDIANGMCFDDVREKYGVHHDTLRRAITKHNPGAKCERAVAHEKHQSLKDEAILEALRTTRTINAAAKKLGIFRDALVRQLRDRPHLARGECAR